MGRIPSAPSSGSCTSAAARPRRAPTQAKGPRSSRPPFASRDEDGLAVHPLVDRLLEHRARALTEDRGDLQTRVLQEIPHLVDRMVAVALAAERAPPQPLALVGEDVDDDL